MVKTWDTPDKTRGFWGSFLECGTLLGFSGGLAVTLILRASLSDDQMMSWGWRIPFLIGLPLGLVGLYLRTKMEDTPVFRELQENDEAEAAATGALRTCSGTTGSRSCGSSCWSWRSTLPTARC